MDPQTPLRSEAPENGNGLLRRWLPKSTNLNTYTPDELRAIEHRINTIPRRRHGGLTAPHLYYAAL